MDSVRRGAGDGCALGMGRAAHHDRAGAGALRRGRVAKRFDGSFIAEIEVQK